MRAARPRSARTAGAGCGRACEVGSGARAWGTPARRMSLTSRSSTGSRRENSVKTRSGPPPPPRLRDRDREGSPTRSVPVPAAPACGSHGGRRAGPRRCCRPRSVTGSLTPTPVLGGTARRRAVPAPCCGSFESLAAADSLSSPAVSAPYPASPRSDSALKSPPDALRVRPLLPRCPPRPPPAAAAPPGPSRPQSPALCSRTIHLASWPVALLSLAGPLDQCCLGAAQGPGAASLPVKGLWSGTAFRLRPGAAEGEDV